MFKSVKKGDKRQEGIISHYQNVDPHKEVADSKRTFFDTSLDYLTSRFKKEGRMILDVGCGYGYFLDLAKKRAWHTRGVEIVGVPAKGAKEKVGGENIFDGSLSEAHYPSESFDAVTLWDILFIVENPYDELRECYRVLKDGGIIGIRVRNIFFQKIAYWIYRPFGRIAWKLGIKAPYVFHLYCYSTKSMQLLLQRIGFTSIQISNSPLTRGDPYSHSTIKSLTRAAKVFVDALSMIIYGISGGKWIIGPSLLIWAEK